MKSKLFLSLLIVNCTLFIGEATAQWWVSGGNLLWPYGSVTVKDSLSVGGNANITGTLTVDNITANNLSVSSVGDLTVNGNLTYTGLLNGVKVYTALLSQEMTSDPSALVLENNLGSITWTRDDIGRYTASFTDFSITPTKLFINAARMNRSSGSAAEYPINFIVSNNYIQIRQDQEDLSNWIGAYVSYDGTVYYPVQFILYP